MAKAVIIAKPFLNRLKKRAGKNILLFRFKQGLFTEKHEICNYSLKSTWSRAREN